VIVEYVVFGICAVIVLSGGLGVVFSRNPVHSALSLVATLFGIAVLFLAQDAQFLAAVQVIVYTGAIVVLFLFVIMLLGVDQEEDVDTEPLVGQRTAGAVIAVSMVALIGAVFILAGESLVTGLPGTTAAILPDVPNVEQIGEVLFTDYVVAFEVTALLLTIAVIGAVVMARRPRDVEPLPEIGGDDDTPDGVGTLLEIDAMASSRGDVESDEVGS
jgi:NADH-quinone oxidoreductase subunit J